MADYDYSAFEYVPPVVWQLDYTDQVVGYAFGEFVFATLVTVLGFNPPPVPAPTVEPVITSTPPPVAYREYQPELAPAWLRGVTGASWLQGVGDSKDEVELRAREALKARYPSLAPLDALVRIGGDRLLDRGVAETDAQYRARLRDAWSAWPWAGTATGVLRALKLAGYDNVWLLGGTGRYATLDGSGNLVVVDVGPTQLSQENFWNDVRVVFAPLPPAWSPTLPSPTGDEVENIRRLIMLWKSAVARFLNIVVLRSGLLWGVPHGVKWGDPGIVWGSDAVVWPGRE